MRIVSVAARLLALIYTGAREHTHTHDLQTGQSALEQSTEEIKLTIKSMTSRLDSRMEQKTIWTIPFSELTVFQAVVNW